MFKENKYKKWYYEIIRNAKERGIISEHTETHHIIPKCLGGSDKSDNLVDLTPKEHFVCHLLLTKLSDERSLKYAFFCMTINNKYQNRYKVTGTLYQLSKRLNSEATRDRMTGVSYNKGRKAYTNQITGEVRMFHSKPDGEWIEGRLTEADKRKISKANKGRKYYHNGEGSVVAVKEESELPTGTWFKGNPNSNHLGESFKGKKYYYNPKTGEEIRSTEQPEGWEEGRCSVWITNGSENRKLNRVLGKVDRGWYFGRTMKHKKYGKLPIVTPLGVFEHPLRFCEKYECGRSIFDNLDVKIRKRKDNMSLVQSLERVGYDFNKTKRENGFYFKENV